MTKTLRRHSSHWGAFTAVVEDGQFVGVRPFEKDPDPSPLIQSMPDAVYDDSRVARPVVRQGWLKHGPGGFSGSHGRSPGTGCARDGECNDDEAKTHC